MSTLFSFPATVMRIAAVAASRGGRALVVGGSVRDTLLGRAAKDWDVEIYGVEPGDVREMLTPFGEVHECGAAFAVFKLAADDGDFDVSIPRRESKTGAGHRGFTVVGDPAMSVREAARRRDFTVNTMAADPLTGELLDPFKGRADLESRVLRVTDPATFGEDSLRVLRGAQFCGRFGLRADAQSAELMRSIDLGDLPAERLFEEFRKGLLKSPAPGLFVAALREFGVLDKLFPMLAALYGCDQEYAFHPESNVGVHTQMVVDVAARLIAEREEMSEAERLTVMLGALCHDLGKPSTTQLIEGRIRQPGHEAAGADPTRALLDILKVNTYQGFDVRGQVVRIVERHLTPGFFGRKRDEVGDGAYRRLAREVRIDLLHMVAVADCLGRGVGGVLPGRDPEGNLYTTACEDYFLERARSLKVDQSPPDPPLLTGRHLMEMGMQGGVELGRVKQTVYEAQLDGRVGSLEEALRMAARLVPQASTAGASLSA